LKISLVALEDGDGEDLRDAIGMLSADGLFYALVELTAGLGEH